MTTKRTKIFTHKICLWNNRPIQQRTYRRREVNIQEKLLSRQLRCTLSKLRSGYNTYQNSYMFRIDSNIQNICPNCQGTPHDPNNILNCPLKPTHLTPSSLWDKGRIRLQASWDMKKKRFNDLMISYNNNNNNTLLEMPFCEFSISSYFRPI